MKISADTYSPTPLVLVQHNGVTLKFSVSYFRRETFSHEYDVFEELNEYWKTLREVQRDQIFKIYQDIHEAFDIIFNRVDLEEFITQKVSELTFIHDLNKIQVWVETSSKIQIPASIPATFVEDIDKNNTKSKTYTRPDYIQLITMAIGFRALVPIWGEFINNTRQDVGNAYKENYAFEILRHSPYLQAPAMIKLREYIEALLQDHKLEQKHILAGMTTEDYPASLRAQVVIKKLSVGDIRGTNPDAHMVSFVHLAISTKFDGRGGEVENTVKEKKLEDSVSDSDGKSSTLERYRIKTDLAVGDIIELEYSVRDSYAVAHRLLPGISDAELSVALETCKVLNTEKIVKPTLTLMQWVMKRVISPRGLLYLSKERIVELIAVAETVLWAKNYKYLAVLISSHVASSDNSMVVAPMDSKMRVPQELTDQLDVLFPHKRVSISRKLGRVETNLAADAINILSNDLASFSWRPTISEPKLREVTGSRVRRLSIKPDVKTDLSSLVISLANRTF